MPRGRLPETYYVYSSIRGNLLYTEVGHKAARKRAATRHLFCNAKDAELVHGEYGQMVVPKEREEPIKRPW